MTAPGQETPTITLLNLPPEARVTLDPRTHGVALQLHHEDNGITEMLLSQDQFKTLAEDCRSLAQTQETAAYSDGEMTITIQPNPDSKITLTTAQWRDALETMPWELYEENESWLHEVNGHVLSFIHTFPDIFQDGEDVLLHMECRDTAPEKPGRQERIPSSPRLASARIRLRLNDPAEQAQLLRAIGGEEDTED